MTLEGVPVLEEHHRGQLMLYARVECQLLGHCKHRRSRTFGQCKGVCSDMGDAEAYAFLGAWLKGGATRTAAGHKSYTPSAAEVYAYASENGWFLGSGCVPSSTRLNQL